jgi:RNA-directed DNA polymerase
LDLFCIIDKEGVKDWGNNVYSFILPKPAHRAFEQICIEHFYLDSEITQTDKNGRRLFLSDEFDKASGKHLKEALEYQAKIRLRRPYPFIIDNSVIDEKGNNVALPKATFADYVLKKENSYRDFTFEHFAAIFEIMTTIIAESSQGSN